MDAETGKHEEIATITLPTEKADPNTDSWENLKKDGAYRFEIKYRETADSKPSALQAMARAIEEIAKVKTAYDKMEPAKVGFGSGVSYLNVKRDLFDAERGTWWEGPDYDGKSDKTVAVMYFQSMEGKPLAVLYNYAMHAVITGNLDMVSQDFPGKSEAYIESRFGDDFVAMFTSGAAGDQNPIYFQQTFDLRDIRIKEFAERGIDISNKMPPGGQGLEPGHGVLKRNVEVAVARGAVDQHARRHGGGAGVNHAHVGDSRAVLCRRTGRGKKRREARGGVNGHDLRVARRRQGAVEALRCGALVQDGTVCPVQAHGHDRRLLEKREGQVARGVTDDRKVLLGHAGPPPSASSGRSSARGPGRR